MEIKNLIERLDDWDGVDTIHNGGFVEVNHHGVFRLLEEATAALEQLQAENDRLRRERDSAVESIPHECKTCLYYTVTFNGCTPDYDCTNLDGGCSNNYDRWVWRGLHKEE